MDKLIRKSVLAGAVGALFCIAGCEREDPESAPQDGRITADDPEPRDEPSRNLPPAPSTETTRSTGTGEHAMAASFVDKAAASGLYEVQSAQLVDGARVRDQVADFARMLVADHTKANDELTAIAKDLGLTLPEQVDETHRQKIEDLRRLAGEEFERRFLEQQVEAHEQAVALFERAAAEQQGELKSFAEKTLPVLRAHLDEAKSLRDG